MTHTNYTQPEPAGCIYYSFASLTQDPSWIARETYRKGCCYHRFRVRAFRKGYMMLPAFVADKPAVRLGFWEDVRTISKPSCPALLHLTVSSLKYEDTLHKIGVRAEGDRFIVFDPGKEDPQVFSPEEFLESPYAQTIEIWEVWSNRLQDFPEVLGPPENPKPIDASS